MKLRLCIAALAVFFVGGVLSCDSGGGVKEAQEPTARKSTARKKKKDDFVPVSSKGKKWGGWRWKGKTDDCYYLAKNRCFNDYKPACKAARCGKKECQQQGAAPVKIFCEGQEPPKAPQRSSKKSKDTPKDGADSDKAEEDAGDEKEASEEPKKKRKKKKRKKKKKKRKKKKRKKKKRKK